MKPVRSTLNVSLTPELASFVAEKVASGQYQSASEVIRAGLRWLQRFDPASGASASRLPPQNETPLAENRLLRALPREDFHELRSRMKRAALKAKRVLYRADAPIERVYFVEHGLASVVGNGLADSQGVEAYVIGPEGMIGIPVVLGVAAVPHGCTVQAEGEALCMETADLRQAMDVLPSFRTVLLRYANHALLQASQAAICNARHGTSERLARWLLMAHDRLEQDDLPLTHIMLGRMLGVRRSSVTAAMGELVTSGAIVSERQHVHVRDRDRLERHSCACYRVLQPAFIRTGASLNAFGRSDLL